jgi:hypothetical protein
LIWRSICTVALLRAKAIRASDHAGRRLSIRNPLGLDSSGKEIARIAVKKQAQNLVFSSADVVSGQTYTVEDSAGTLLASVTANQATGGMGRR